MRTALVTSIYTALKGATQDDTFIFYFSGHGGKNCLILSDSLIELQDLINTIEQIHTKNKIVILDSCHSGGFAVLASCGAEQSSGFNEERKISLYTSFVCDALTSR